MKRLFDFLAAFFGLLFLSPVLFVFMFLVWWQDKHNPFYIAPRVGKGGRIFKMVKLRSMIVNADKSGVDSSSNNDNRITKVGQMIRRYKLDEITQLWNVLLGHMSLVGPRPNVKRETSLYTSVEEELLTVRPGITDLASIVFSDEGDILEGTADPDIAYNQLIRPWKSRLGIISLRHSSLFFDIKLIFLTILAVISREKALDEVVNILESIEADPELIEVAKRDKPLEPSPPPGSNTIVTSRDQQV
jgi:lipopolysaccharide/colanic/teichoic acid biosynthesis glycosyltransferase